VGKQLRKMGDQSRVFSTGIGVRPAEPCSISVAATHQLLTQILQNLAFTVVGRGLHSSTSQLNLSRVWHKKTPYTP